MGSRIVWARRQKTVIRANYGIFYDAPQTNVYFNATAEQRRTADSSPFEHRPLPLSRRFPHVLHGAPSAESPVQDIFTVSPNFQDLYTINANLQSPAS